MKSAWKAICILLMFWLALAPMHALGQAKSTSQASAKAKAAALAKAKAQAKIKAKAKAKAKAQAKIKAKPKAKATIPSSRGTAMAPSRSPADENSLDAEVAAARRIVTGNPGDVAARDRLARAAVSLIDLLLQAEAVGDREKAQHLAQKLEKDLHDTGGQIGKMAQNGDLKARQAMGFLLGRGVLLKKDADKSCVEFLAAAEELAPAGWHAAQCLMEASPEKAWVQMERAAQRGHAAAQEWMGRRCLGEFGGKEKDYACARGYLIESASFGRSRAQTLLAYLLMSGQGGPVDVSRAIRLYKVAAAQGDADAQNNLGEIYEMGRGVPRNLNEAMRWYELAAQKGLGSAQFNAGRLWAIGVGEKKDPARARAFLVQAEGNGVAQARQVLDWLDRQTPQAPDAPSAQGAATAPELDAPKN
ncbi:MAG: tetratricopeptide repeat protein [Rhodocyclales bacterium]|nr:tetratricopeptide repeat protein [Rhodocyclales bacterium]